MNKLYLNIYTCSVLFILNDIWVNKHYVYGRRYKQLFADVHKNTNLFDL